MLTKRSVCCFAKIFYSNYMVISLMWDSSPQPSNLCPSALSIKSNKRIISKAEAYIRSKSTQTCSCVLAIQQVWASLELTLYCSSISTLSLPLFTFSILLSLVASLTLSRIYSLVNYKMWAGITRCTWYSLLS